MKSNVYFTRTITPEKVVELYRALGVTLPGKVAVKVHSGEKGNQNFLHPDFWKPMVEAVNGTIVECNTAYGDASGGVRDNTDSHWKLMEEHGWTKDFTVDIMDAEGPDVVWPIPNGKILKENHLGKNIENYDSMLVLAHFKGHPMGGYGGALKQLSIGCASRAGKALIHSAGKTDDRYKTWEQHASPVEFPEAMADAAESVVAHFKGKIAYINVMKNLSVDCDCCAVAEDPACRISASSPLWTRLRLTRPALTWSCSRPTPARSILWSGSTAATASTPLKPQRNWAPAAGNIR